MRLIIDYTDGEGTKDMLKGIKDNLSTGIEADMGSKHIINVEIYNKVE